MRALSKLEEQQAAREAQEIESSVTPEMRARHKRGMIIGVIGLAVFFPALAAAIFSQPFRIHAAIVALVSWIVWKIGKTIMKINSVTA